MQRERDTLELLMSTYQAPWVSPGEPRHQFPLLATGIEFGDSRMVPQIQVADVVAGASAYAMGALARGGQTDAFASELREHLMPLLAAGTVVWPDTEVDPAKLAPSDDGEGLEVVMHIAAAERARRSGRANG